jgi:hypothetical protein
MRGYKIGLILISICVVFIVLAAASAKNELTIDDDRFEVVGDLLKLKAGASLDFEQESQVTLRLTATDSEGLSYSEDITLRVGDVNDAPVAGDDMAAVHLESDGAEPVLLWEDDFSGDWRSRWPVKWSEPDDRYATKEYFERDGETWIRVIYPEGETGKGFKMVTNHDLEDRVYFEYKVRFADDFDWVIGGKLPGLSGMVPGGDGGASGQKPTGDDFWSVRFMWAADGKGFAYAYHPDQPNRYGENIHFPSHIRFQKGVVQTLGLEVVMNTPGQHDGILRGWLDGVLVVERTDIRWRDVPELQIDAINFGSIFGGNTADWAPSKDETIEFGDFKLYIGSQ